MYDLPGCFARAHCKALNHENITAGFRKTGIWPINLDTVSEIDFIAASVFNDEIKIAHVPDIEQPTTSGVNQHTGSSHSHDSSFEELMEVRPLPKRKPSDIEKPPPKRRIAGCRYIPGAFSEEKHEEEPSISEMMLPIDVKDPQAEEYVLVKLKPEKSKMFFVASCV